MNTVKRDYCCIIVNLLCFSVVPPQLQEDIFVLLVCEFLQIVSRVLTGFHLQHQTGVTYFSSQCTMSLETITSSKL